MCVSEFEEETEVEKWMNRRLCTCTHLFASIGMLFVFSLAFLSVVITRAFCEFVGFFHLFVGVLFSVLVLAGRLFVLHGSRNVYVEGREGEPMACLLSVFWC